MNPLPPRVPPRYVPTLTEVVSVEQVAPEPPMLDDILSAGGLASALLASAAPAQPLAAAALHPPGTQAGQRQVAELEDELVHRVLQRIDVSIDHRLQVAVVRLVDEYTRQLAPRLRAEVAEVVRQAVSDALARELAAPSGTAQGLSNPPDPA